MYLRVISDFLSENLINEISSMTDNASLKVKEVMYNKESGQILLPIERFRIYKKKKIFNKHDVHDDIRIPSIITINNVIDCNIKKNCDDITNILLLFGLVIKKSSISICSAEEVSGAMCYSIELQVGNFDIEIKDKS